MGASRFSIYLEAYGILFLITIGLMCSGLLHLG